MGDKTSAALELALQLVTALDEAVVLPGEIAMPDIDEVRVAVEVALNTLRQQPAHLSDGEVWGRLHAAAKVAGSAAALAREIGITKQSLADVLAGRKEPGPAILRHMGLRKVLRGHVYTHADVEPRASPRPISERHQRTRDMLPRIQKSVPAADGTGVSP